MNMQDRADGLSIVAAVKQQHRVKAFSNPMVIGLLESPHVLTLTAAEGKQLLAHNNLSLSVIEESIPDRGKSDQFGTNQFPITIPPPLGVRKKRGRRQERCPHSIGSRRFWLSIVKKVELGHTCSYTKARSGERTCGSGYDIHFHHSFAGSGGKPSAR